jgi:CheY-like chemotaxis protein
MGGNLEVESVVGRGSIFYFDVAITLAEADEVTADRPRRRVVGLEPDQPVFRLLVVEDRAANRQLLVKLLSSLGTPPQGFDIRVAVNGQEALEVWEAWDPHLIWMDMRMPVMDGYEATKRIKATAKGQATVVVALTASAFEEDRALILSQGCDDFVSKPFREVEIFDKLEMHLGVRFIYEDLSRDKRSQAEEDDLSSLATLVDQSEAWLADLHAAAMQADGDQVLNLIAHLDPDQPVLDQALTTLVHNFRFDRIMTLASEALTDKTGE